MKIYLDNVAMFGLPYNEVCCYTDYTTIPNDCNLIGITFYNNFYQENLEKIRILQTKTKKLIVVVIEPTVGKNTFDWFIKSIDPNVFIFGLASLNFDQPNYTTIVPWFDTPINYYATSVWAKELITQLTVDWKKPKKFDCLLGLTRNHRDVISKLYNSSQFQDCIFFSYFQNSASKGTWHQYQEESKNATLTTHKVSIGNEMISLSVILPIEIYNQTYYSIIAETTCSNAYSHFTEKTAKPIVARRPFVAFSGQYFLRNLRKLGFKTFDSVVDESYDLIPDMSTRMSAAWNQVELLCQQDPRAVYEKLQPVLDHNYDLFINTRWLQNLHEFVSGATSRDRTWFNGSSRHRYDHIS